MATDVTVMDPLDLMSHRHEKCNTMQDIRTGTAQLVFALLKGWTPTVSQTQAFDSAVILGARVGRNEGRRTVSVACKGWPYSHSAIRATHAVRRIHCSTQ